ncbi:hypothetical protein QVD17_26074 [Tagetes erecta]|uniref:RING-type E3 ubiquitin transferase n=1 Tax=Tagetes erecta TaxID=13708 RepID=A0AAD8K6T3_TARER|nr:hypothetical protein QVD17_26074 [Tagetes erecta]
MVFIVIPCIVVVHCFPKRRRRQATEDANNCACEQQGVDDTLLNTIPVIQFDPERFKDGLECAICLSEVNVGEKIRVLPKCDHGFHFECIDMWFRSHSTCPVCRKFVGDQLEITVDQQESLSVVVEGSNLEQV